MTRIWVGGPTVVKRVVRTLELMQAATAGSWVHGTTRGSIQLPRDRRGALCGVVGAHRGGGAQMAMPRQRFSPRAHSGPSTTEKKTDGGPTLC